VARKRKKKDHFIVYFLACVICSLLVYYGQEIKDIAYKVINNRPVISYNLDEIPNYSGKDFVYLNDNKPNFDESDLNSDELERYSKLDKLGRCGQAFAKVGKETMPTTERGSIGSIKPSGWHTVKYDNVDGKYLYNRCHLIGYQLTGENANPNNLITCTRHMNADSMLKFENKVAEYVKKTNHHVLYRVTPVFKDNNLVASGVIMEAQSIEDNKISFNVFVYNVQDGIDIDYLTGESKLKD